MRSVPDRAQHDIGTLNDRPVTFRVNGSELEAAPGTTVAAALINAGITSFRSSPGGEERGPLCGMGICFECRATVDGVSQTRTCQMLVAAGMEVETV